MVPLQLQTFCVRSRRYGPRNQLLRSDLTVAFCPRGAGGWAEGEGKSVRLGTELQSSWHAVSSCPALSTIICLSFYCTREVSCLALTTLCGDPYYFLNNAVPVCSTFTLALL